MASKRTSQFNHKKKVIDEVGENKWSGWIETENLKFVKNMIKIKMKSIELLFKPIIQSLKILIIHNIEFSSHLIQYFSKFCFSIIHKKNETFLKSVSEFFNIDIRNLNNQLKILMNWNFFQMIKADD